MAAQIPDHRTLSSWEDAFNSTPVPTIRALERSVRSDISTNHARLRSLVGGSYRDLLSTAATIADMDKRMRGLESLLSDDISRKCNSRTLERTRIRSKQLSEVSRSTETAELRLAARVSVLRACPGAIIRISREERTETREVGLLTAAKVLVLGRVLYTQKLKGLDQAPPNEARFTGVVEAAFKRLRAVREKLRSAIEERIASESSSVEQLLDALAAYSLVMQASAAEVLRYFHQTRAAAITRLLDSRGDDSGPVKALQIWLQTLRDTQAVFPRQLAGALSQLKAQPLLAGEDMLAITAFDLDIHLNWLGEDIKGFVPTYVRHDDLDIAAAKKQLSTWAPATLKTYLGQLQTSLDTKSDLPTVARLRKECLVAWFSGSARITGVPRSDVLSGLRGAFSQRLAQLTEHKSGSLSSLSTRLRTTLLTSWNESETTPYAPTPWSPQTISLSLSTSNGASAFTNSLQATLQGRSRAADSILSSYREWLSDLEAIDTIIAEQRKLRWQDLGEDYYDSDDSDEEEAREHALSKEDPDSLEKQLSGFVNKAVSDFQISVREIAKSITSAREDGQAHIKAAFLLRLLRQIRAQLPRSYSKTLAFDDFQADLHRLIAAPVLASVKAKHGLAIVKSLQKDKLAVRGLWSEITDLPILPSPWAFRVLRTAHSAMQSAGPDLWVESAVGALKAELKRQLADDMSKTRKAADTVADAAGGKLKAKTAGTEEKVSKSGEKSEDGEGTETSNATDAAGKETNGRDKYTQQLFDVQYLAASLNAKKTDSNSLDQHADWLVQCSKLAKEKQEQVMKGAEDYWKRTSLLFALLA